MLRKLTILTALLTLLAGCSSRTKPEPLWIGHLAPLSGQQRDSGEEAIRAINSVLETAGEDDFKVAGRPVGVRHVDSVKDARAEATRLLAVNRVSALLVGPGVANVEDILSAVRSHSAPVVVLDEVASVPASPGTFLLASDPGQRGQVLAKYARQTLKLAKVAVIVDGTRPTCVAFAEAFGKEFREGNGTLREWDLASIGDRQVEFLAFQPTALLAAVSGKELATLNERWGYLAGGRVLLFGGEPDADLRLGWKPVPKEVTAVYGVTAFAPQAKLPEESQKLLDTLGKKHSAPGRSSAFAVDGIRFVLEGLKSARTSQPDKFLKALEGIREFESVTGPMVWKEGRPMRPLYIIRSPDVVAATFPGKE